MKSESGKQSFNDEGADTTMDAEMEKLKSAAAAEEITTEKTEAWHKPKKGSVFPAKRRSVKQMMCDLVFGKNKKKNNHVFSCDIGE